MRRWRGATRVSRGSTSDEHSKRAVDWLIALRPDQRARLPVSNPLHAAEQIKARVRAKVEHPFRYIKQVFGYRKVRYRGLDKNSSRLHLLAGFTNLRIGRTYLPSQGQCAR
jgi:IS5 family transposase